MSLKEFHIVFIMASALLAFAFGAWSLRHYSASGSPLGFMVGVASLAAGAALLGYLAFFRKKMKAEHL